MPKLRVLVPVAGDPSWSAGEVVHVDQDVFDVWADGVRGAPAGLGDATPDDIEEWVGDDGPRAAHALSVELNRSEPRDAVLERCQDVLEAAADAAAAAAAEADATADPAAVPSTVDDVKEWVGDDADRAVVALEVERARSEGPRKTLEPWLEDVATTPPA